MIQINFLNAKAFSVEIADSISRRPTIKSHMSLSIMDMFITFNTVILINNNNEHYPYLTLRTPLKFRFMYWICIKS